MTPYDKPPFYRRGTVPLCSDLLPRRERREKLYVIFALTPQYMALGALLLYALLRVLLTPQVPFSYYVGPLVLLWPAAYLLLLLSYVSDKLLWDE